MWEEMPKDCINLKLKVDEWLREQISVFGRTEWFDVTVHTIGYCIGQSALLIANALLSLHPMFQKIRDLKAFNASLVETCESSVKFDFCT